MAKIIHGIELTVELHKDHDQVEKVQNVPGAETTFLRVKPGENQTFLFPNDNPIRMKLYDDSGVELPNTARISIWKIPPGGREPKKLGERNYANWRNTDLADQGDPLREPNLSIPFSDPGLDAVAIPPGYALEFRIKFDAQTGVTSGLLDMDNPNTQIIFSVGEEIET